MVYSFHFDILLLWILFYSVLLYVSFSKPSAVYFTLIVLFRCLLLFYSFSNSFFDSTLILLLYSHIVPLFQLLFNIFSLHSNFTLYSSCTQMCLVGWHYSNWYTVFYSHILHLLYSHILLILQLLFDIFSLHSLLIILYPDFFCLLDILILTYFTPFTTRLSTLL